MKKLLIGMVALSVLAVGCGSSPEKQVVGSWKADTAKSEISGEALKTEADKKMAKSMLETINIELKEDKKFTMTLLSFPIEGTWAMSGSKLTLTPTKKEGESSSFGGKENLDFEVAGDTMTSTTTDKGVTTKLVMTKAAK